MSIVLGLLGEVGTLPKPRGWAQRNGYIWGASSIRGMLGKGPGSTRETKCPAWGSGFYAVHGFSLESRRKLCLVLLVPWGVYNVPVSGPRGAPGRWQAGISQAEAGLLLLLLHGEV